MIVEHGKNSKPGKFIVIEGCDSSGKHTQATLLVKHLARTGIDIEQLSFPQYNTPIGESIASYLRGEYGSLNNVTIEIPSLLYALDRYQVKRQIESGLATGKWFVADRYTQSNLAHQGAKLDGQRRIEFINWLDTVESRLPIPDLIVYLHVPVAITKLLMDKRKQKTYLEPKKNKDIHEQDINYQQRVVEMYIDLSKNRDNWVVLDCVNELTKDLESIEIIHHKLAKIIEERFGLKKHH